MCFGGQGILGKFPCLRDNASAGFAAVEMYMALKVNLSRYNSIRGCLFHLFDPDFRGKSIEEQFETLKLFKYPIFHAFLRSVSKFLIILFCLIF